MATVHIHLHSAAQPATYAGLIGTSFIEGSEQLTGEPVTVSVPRGSRPVGRVLSGIITRKPGRYALWIALDAGWAGDAATQRIAEEIPVSVTGPS